MKKNCTLLVATILISFGFNNKAAAQVEEGSILIDTYYGFPNFGKNLWSILENDSTQNTKATGIGPLGFRFEYMIADNLGVGFDFNYLDNGFKYEETFTSYNSTTMTYETNTYEYQYKKTKMRFMARLHYHFVVTDVVDAYVGFGAGYKHKINKFESNDPNASEETLESLFNGAIPVSARICIGTRFFFTENIGINLEMGVGGGPLLSAGVSFKF